MCVQLYTERNCPYFSQPSEMRINLFTEPRNSKDFTTECPIPNSVNSLSIENTPWCTLLTRLRSCLRFCFWPSDRSLPARAISSRKLQWRKNIPLKRTFLKQICRPCLIMIKCCYFDYRINKPFACSRCVICVSCSVHVISTCYARKGS